MSREDDDNQAVGYKNPPKHSRFKKGQSGNPSGRRKRASNENKQDDREIVLSQRVPMTIGGKRVNVTARRAIYQKLVAMSLGGSLGAAGMLLKRDSLNDNKPEPHAVVSDEELEAMIEHYQARKRGKGGNDG